jgi:hypothetical protein
MKKNILILLMVLPAFIIKGQYPVVKNIGDTIGPFTVISFEEPSPYITIVPLSQNIWQIGAPHKTFFNSAYTPPNAIVTDTINNYPVNNLSSFELIVGAFNAPFYPWCLFIDFHHKYDTDTLSDGGYITVSWDNGLTWMNIVDDTANNYGVTPHRPSFSYGNTNLYDTISTLYSGEHGFSGNSGGWVHSCMAWYDNPCKKRPEYPSDTMRLRFNFISDGIQQNHEGWMVDQIRLFSIDLGSGIHEYLAGRSHSYFLPNPVTTTATFTLNKTYCDVHYEIMDSRGILISKSDRGTCDEFTFERTGIPSGMYLMRLFLDNQFIDTHRIIIAP